MIKTKNMGAKMKNKIFNKKLSKFCKNCAFSVETAGTDLLCRHRGAVSPDDVCRKYKYDPLKRNPELVGINNDFNEEDFKL